MKTLGLVAFLVVLGWSGFASGTIITLTDLNSVAQLDSGSQAGMFSWSVDGVNALTQRWFWYRVGLTDPEHSLDTLGAPTINQSDAADLKLVYTNAQFQVTLNYSLTGGVAGSGQSDMNVGINIKNLTSSALDLHFFDYADANLSPGADTAVVDSPGRIVQTAGASQMDFVSTLKPGHSQVGLPSAILTALTDAFPTQLSDNASAGPGNANGAFEWDLTLAGNGSKTWGEAVSLQIPEPATLGLLALGGLGLLRGRRRG